MTANRSSKSLTVMLLDRRGLRDAGVGDEDVETVADQVADLSGKDVGAVRRREIGRDRIGAAAGRPNLVDHGLRLIGVATVVNDDTRARGRKCQCGGAAHSAGRAGDESGLICEVSHDCILHAVVLGDAVLAPEDAPVTEQAAGVVS